EPPGCPAVLHSFPTRRSSDLRDRPCLYGAPHPAGGIGARRQETVMALTPSTMLELGTVAPDFALPDTEGNVVRREDFASRPLLVDRKSTRLNSSHVKISYAVF